MTRKEEAYNFIRKEIVQNRLHPNEVISENQITDQLNMSRTPVREAMKQLVADGLVEMRGRENVVTPLTASDVQEVYELRSLLETYALKKTINLIPEFKLNEIEKEFEEAYQHKNWDDYLEVDTEFHGLITHIAGYGRLKQFLKILKAQTARTRHVSSYNPHRMGHSIEEHKEIINWIRKRNLDEAEKALAYHLQKVYDSVKSYLNYLNE
ncbi:GntR family transcriptional regulator [Lactobacillus sp. 0.1XD8-4]|uniref:GntR family transcriptional regulator n=1 Tax=uncultured Limosilactobacillus sp. TaxID=2837629 RepID=UPI00129EF19B|nr:GntR family transcriptional regulator [uncultured Limosilactobacillus sp.]MRN05854.1 GntR family transcriptional regulator [Lactobacillus sp. 0.1XD8-4]